MLPAKAAQKQSITKPPGNLSPGESEVKQLLVLMDANQNGKISKQEWMKFMDAEFDRLDKDQRGELDVKETARSKVPVSRFASQAK